MIYSHQTKAGAKVKNIKENFRYASYWNAFLFILYLLPTQLIGIEKRNLIVFRVNPPPLFVGA